MAIKTSEKIASDAIFVPGHTGDFICGGHIPQSFRQSECARDEDLIREIFDRHYALVLPARKRREKWRQTFAARILQRAEAEVVSDAVTAADAYEKWEWQERQAKFIVNSVRVYEYWGYDWWCPFWDAEVMRYWEGVSLSHRTAEFYQEYVQDQWPRICRSIWVPIANSANGANLLGLRRRIVRSAAAARLGRWMKFHRNPLATAGRYSFFRTLNLVFRGFTTNGLAADDFLRTALGMGATASRVVESLPSGSEGVES